MGKELDVDEIAVKISGAEENYPNREVEIESMEKEDTINANQETPTEVNRIPRTPLMASPGRYDDDDDDLLFKTGKRSKKNKSKKMKVLFFIEFSLFVCITLFLVLSTTMDKLKKTEIWSLDLWKWSVLGLAIFCGRLFSEWFTNVVVFLIEKEIVLEKNYLYFINRRQKSFQLFIWLGLILPTWCLLINRGDHRSKHTNKILNYVTRGIASSLVVAGAWVLEVMFVNMLYTSFYVKRHFDRILEDIFNGYVIETLSGAPVMEIFDVGTLLKIQRGKVSAWTMRELIKVVRKSAFTTDFITLNVRTNTEEEEEYDIAKNSITNEMEAIAAAYHIFRNVAVPGCRYIEELDIRRFFDKDDTDTIFAMMDPGYRGQIDRKHLTNWLVNVYANHKYLVNSLNDTRKAIEELNKILTGLTVAVLVILWLILTGIATTEVLLFISSQVLLAVFSLGATAKSTFESLIFVFVKHPFDVGDRCVIDGVQVVVEEMSIMTTVFLRYDNEKIYYPNSLLATKSISNFNRSPDMADSVDFDLDVSTSVENISALKVGIKKYIERNPQLWHPRHKVRVREIEGANKIKMSLHITHTINFQNYSKKMNRRSKLMFELKNIFETLGIGYHILPPRYPESATTTTLMS